MLLNANADYYNMFSCPQLFRHQVIRPRPSPCTAPAPPEKHGQHHGGAHQGPHRGGHRHSRARWGSSPHRHDRCHRGTVTLWMGASTRHYPGPSTRGRARACTAANETMPAHVANSGSLALSTASASANLPGAMAILVTAAAWPGGPRLLSAPQRPLSEVVSPRELNCQCTACRKTYPSILTQS